MSLFCCEMAWFIRHNGFIIMKSAILYEQVPCRHIIKIVFLLFFSSPYWEHTHSVGSQYKSCGAFIVLQGLKVSNYDNNVFDQKFALSVDCKRKLSEGEHH